MDEKTLAMRALLYARDAIADKKDADGAPHSAAAIRAGDWDEQHEVKDAALGARAAILGLYPLVSRVRVNKCVCARRQWCDAIIAGAVVNSVGSLSDGR